MRRLELDSIAIPHVGFPQHLKIAHKVSPRGADLAELRRILDDRIADGDAAIGAITRVLYEHINPCKDVK